jgi:hypothetical protein
MPLRFVMVLPIVQQPDADASRVGTHSIVAAYRSRRWNDFVINAICTIGGIEPGIAAQVVGFAIVAFFGVRSWTLQKVFYLTFQHVLDRNSPHGEADHYHHRRI